jgi:hypothetical protein
LVGTWQYLSLSVHQLHSIFHKVDKQIAFTNCRIFGSLLASAVSGNEKKSLARWKLDSNRKEENLLPTCL